MNKDAINVYITVSNAYHIAYRKPHQVASALAEQFDVPVLSVTVCDTSTGLTASCRYGD